MGDYVWSINGQEVFEMSHNQICNIIKGAGTSIEMVVERGDHIVPNFEEIWPSNKDKSAKYKRRLIGMESILMLWNIMVSKVTFRNLKILQPVVNWVLRSTS